MLLLHFLELCVGDFNLWPSYIFDLLFLKAGTPRHIGEAAAFFYGHKVPLKVASRVYAICNTNRAVHGAIPFLMGAYYAAYYYQCDRLHMAQYFDVRRGQLQWITGRNHPQSERSSLPIVVQLISIAGPYDTTGCRRALRTSYTLTCPPCLTKRPSI